MSTTDQQVIRLPYQYEPRTYQLPLLAKIDQGIKRAVCIWHRRAGKDKTLINLFPKRMMQQVGVYYYFFPTYQQGRKILWEGIDKQGMRFLSHFPKELMYSINNQEMMLQMVHPTDRDEAGKPLPGSIFRVIGTDKIDSIVGTNPIFAVFSEYSLQDPRAWSFIRPILAENGGVAIFNYTPRGANHGKQLYDLAKRDDGWFAQKLTVDDTQAIPQSVLDQERREMLEQTGSDALFMQEYYCSFDAPVEGAYYGAHLLKAEEENRITQVPYDSTLPVRTYWDLGIDDSMTIWFVQQVGREVRLIDYEEGSGEGLLFYAKMLKDKGYLYDEHWMPHDAEVRELGTGKSRREVAESLGIRPIRVAKRPEAKEDGIEAVRGILSRCYFDEIKCERGLNALRSYQKVFDDKNNVYKPTPLHNWASHGADAFQTLGISFKDVVEDDVVEEVLFDQEGFFV